MALARRVEAPRARHAPPRHRRYKCRRRRSHCPAREFDDRCRRAVFRPPAPTSPGLSSGLPAPSIPASLAEQHTTATGRRRLHQLGSRFCQRDTIITCFIDALYNGAARHRQSSSFTSLPRDFAARSQRQISLVCHIAFVADAVDFRHAH